MDIFLIRHGESIGNIRRVFLGHTDWSLSPLGREQAEKTADFLLTKPVDAVFASDLARARQSANAFAKKACLPVQTDIRLREVQAGLWEAQSFDDIRRRYTSDHAAWLHDIDNARPTEGESVLHLQNRVVSCVRELAQSHPGQTLALFTHATPIRALYARLANVTMASLPWPGNASVTHIRFENGFLPVLYGQDDFLGEIHTEPPKDI